jgi:hypothetical protein
MQIDRDHVRIPDVLSDGEHDQTPSLELIVQRSGRHGLITLTPLPVNR